MNVKEVATRGIAGALYVLVILLGILGGEIAFLIIFGTILGFALFEFYRMIERETSHTIDKTFNIASGIIAFVAFYLQIKGVTTVLLPILSLGYLLILVTSALFLKRDNVLNGIIYSVFGHFYITLPLGIMMLMTNMLVNIIYLFIFIWVNDTAAYVVGSLLGKHKLIEHISPNKSVEGFIGGIVFSALAAVVIANFNDDVSMGMWIIFGVVVALFGTLGDLFESLIKRTYNVKDTGNLIPGHGGILDRIDSLLIAIPAVYLLWML
ncbi:MAG: phosphatidate cytidylyltransferase [Fermentimonas sp.]